MQETRRSLNSIIDSMEMGWLPSPPHIFCKLVDICHDPDSSIAELADIISADAVLTSKVITAINSAAFAIKEPIRSLQDAIALLGHNQVKTMVLSSSIQQLFAGLVNSRKKVICDAWLDSIYCAVFAQDIAHALNYEYPQDAYLAGLLRDFGKIVFEARFHEEYASILGSEPEIDTVSKELSQFGVSHAELGATIIERWSSLSPAIADAARFHHEKQPYIKGCDLLCQIVAEASQIAGRWCQYGVADPKWHSELLDDEALERIYIRAQDKVSKIVATLDIPAPETGSITQDDLCKDLDKVIIKLGRKIRDASLINVIGPETRFPVKINSPRSLLLKIAQELQLVFSIPDVVLLFPDLENTNLLSLYEINHTQPVSKFSVDNYNSKIIKSFVEKNNFWIEPENVHREVTPITDRQIIRRLNHDIAFSLPLVSQEQVIGVVVIGVNREQKGYLSNQSNFISGYLKNVADIWLKNNQVLKQQAFDGDAIKQLEQNNIEKLVHEISNPLSVIGNYIDIINANSNSDGIGNSKEIMILKEELLRIKNIVIDFKDAKTSESGSVFLNNELKMCIPLYVKSIDDDKEIQIRWNLDESDSEIEISRDALRQIVLNLIKNAVESQNSDAEILISSHHFVNMGGVIFAQFSIADRGNGVDAVTRERLFSPLTSTKEGANRGYGLSVIVEILNRFNGQIKYLENGFGGASFEVLIPLRIKNSPDN